mgnify:CR=1 FL=1
MVRKSSTPATSIDDSPGLAHLVHRLIQVAAHNCTLETLLTELANVLGESLAADGCAIVVSSMPSGHLKTACWFGGVTEPVTSFVLGRYENLMRRLHCPQTLIVPDLQQQDQAGEGPCPSTDRTVWQELAFSGHAPVSRAILEVPVCCQRRIHGVISLMRSHPHSWTMEDAETLETVSQQISTLFYQACLQQQVAQQALYQQVINQLTMAIRNSTDLGEVLAIATQGTTQALQAQRGLLLRLKYQDLLLRGHIAKELPKARVTIAYEWCRPTPDHLALMTGTNASEPPTSFWLSDCELCQESFRALKPIIVKHRRYLAHEIAAAQIHPAFATNQFGASLVVPLESQGAILGFLVFQDMQPRSWQQAEIDFAELASAQVSTAILQTETLRQVQALVEKRTSELQQSLAIQARLYEKTRQQLDQLRHLNQLKDEFLDTVSHELRTPLTSMALAIRMLRQVGMAGDRGTRYLDILEQQCAQETNLVNDLLALQELEANQVPLNAEAIMLEELIAALSEGFHRTWATAKGLQLVVEATTSSLWMQSDRDSLNRVLLELLTNAGKYSAPNSQIQLKVMCQPGAIATPPQIVISLTNQGIGIGSTDLPHVFERFRRCKGVTQQAIPGTGLGLALVKRLVEHLQGTISVASTPIPDSEEWETCFTLLLPQTLTILKLPD